MHLEGHGMLFGNYGLETSAQRKLVLLQDAIFLETCLETWEKDSLQVAEDMLHVETPNYNFQWSKKVHAIVAENPTELDLLCTIVISPKKL